jgi:hypothetical protein
MKRMAYADICGREKHYRPAEGCVLIDNQNTMFFGWLPMEHYTDI